MGRMTAQMAKMKLVVPHIDAQLMNLLVLMENACPRDFTVIMKMTVEITVMKLAVPPKNVPQMNSNVVHLTVVSLSIGGVTRTEIALTAVMKLIAIKQIQAIPAVQLNSSVQTMSASPFLGSVMATRIARMQVMNKIAQNNVRVNYGDANQVGI